MASSSSSRVPKDAQVIISMLNEAGITDYEPRVVNQMLEFTYRYVTSLLDEARVYAQHGKKKIIDLEDVKLAVTMQTDKVNTSAPPRDVLMEIAKSRNSIPLPPVKLQNGLRLPPDRFCLSSCNYKLQSHKKAKPATKVTSSLISSANRMGNQQRSGVGMKSTMPGTGMTMVSSLQPATPLKTKIVGQNKPVIKISSSATMPKIQISSGAPQPTMVVANPASMPTQEPKKEEPEPMDTSDV